MSPTATRPTKPGLVAASLRADMSLPVFSIGDDPGPNFLDLLKKLGQRPAPFTSTDEVPIRHATTIVSIRYVDGVVMAGDRRATEGHSIAHRAIEKVYPADNHSGVAFAGAAGPALEMVKLFQVQLEHYEKIEGQPLSLEGKANQLGQMVAQNLPMAMQGLGVVPLFGGYDHRRAIGRLFTYDMTGGRYEEADYAATGSGGRDARTAIKLGYKEGLTRAEVIELAVKGLYEAADEDSATGGPDVIRGIYPTVATITATGFERVPDIEVAERFQAYIATKVKGGHPV